MGQKRLRTFLAHKFYNAFLQRYLVVDLFALLNDDALGQLFCGKADSGSSDFFAVCQHTALYYQTASLAVGSSQTGLDHQGQNADGTVRQIVSRYLDDPGHYLDGLEDSTHA